MTMRIDREIIKYTDVILLTRNKPAVRNQMVSDRIISVEEHQKWIHSFANCGSSKFGMVCLIAGSFAGFCHIKPATYTSVEWSFFKDPDRQDVSGLVMCAHFINFIFQHSNRKELLGRVKMSNVASYRCHKRLGFEKSGCSSDMARFELKQEKWEEIKHIFL